MKCQFAVSVAALAAVAILEGRTAAQSPPANVTGSLKECLLANGIGYSPFRDGQGPVAGIPVSMTQVDEDLRFLGQITRRIRFYDAEGALSEAAQTAARLGLRVAQGIHLDEDHVRNEQRIATALALAAAGVVDSVIVGNEVLTGSKLSKEELSAYLRRVRRDTPAHIAVTTAETWDKWLAYPDLANDVDLVVAHFYPFWEDHPIAGAASYVLERYQSLKRLLDHTYPLRDLSIVVGETGWPSAGRPRALGVDPSPENQLRFATEFMSLACAASIPFYYFAGFDEEWKWREGSSSAIKDQDFPEDRTFSSKWIGSSWGLYRSNGTLKPQFSGLIDQPPVASREVRDILVKGQLASFYDIGVDTSRQRRDWVSTAPDSLKMAYPADQAWGAVFITVGRPVDPPRPWKDFSEFGTLSLELRGENGGETVEIGIKHHAAADDGGERKVRLVLSKEFSRHDIPLSQFASSRTVIPGDLERLYVVAEFVFDGATPRSIYVRSVQYRPAAR